MSDVPTPTRLDIVRRGDVVWSIELAADDSVISAYAICDRCGPLALTVEYRHDQHEVWIVVDELPAHDCPNKPVAADGHSSSDEDKERCYCGDPVHPGDRAGTCGDERCRRAARLDAAGMIP